MYHKYLMGNIQQNNIKQTNFKYNYEIIEKEKQYFKKHLVNVDNEMKNNLKNEVEKIKVLEDYDCFPKIVKYDLKTKFYIIYDYIEGKTLDKYKNLTLLESINILIDVASIIEFIHSKNIVHCDLKPSNIMIDKNKKVYIIDFGNARFIGEKTEYGSKRYCSTLQLEKKEVTKKFDIYSFGIIMYELITGYKAYNEVHNYEDLLIEKKNNILTISNIILNIPKFADEIVYKLLVGSKEYSYKDIKEVKKDLLKLKSMLKKHSV